jgi:hypothetical protein
MGTAIYGKEIPGILGSLTHWCSYVEVNMAIFAMII